MFNRSYMCSITSITFLNCAVCVFFHYARARAESRTRHRSMTSLRGVVIFRFADYEEVAEKHNNIILVTKRIVFFFFFFSPAILSMILEGILLHLFSA